MWFKGDDGWHKHRKRIRTGVDMEGMAAQGLWFAAGTWCADELTDGWVPDYIVDYLAPGIGRQLAKRLEVAVLWHPEDRDGESGWQFHQWKDHQRTREQVLAERQASADRQADARKRAAERKKAATDARHTAEMRDIRAQSDRSNGGSHAVTNGVRHAPVTSTRPDLTRPDQTVVPTELLPEEDQTLLPHAARTADDGPAVDDGSIPTLPGTDVVVAKTSPPAKGNRGTRLPDGWMPSVSTREWAAKEFPAVDLRSEHMKFTNHWLSKTGRDATKIDWDRTWQNWIITAAERAGIRRGQPAAVLNDGRSLGRKATAHLDHAARYGDIDD